MPNPELTAFHEAGHVATAWHFGIPVTEVSIVPVGDFDGHYCYRSKRLPRGMYPNGKARRRAIGEAMMILAGKTAQQKLSPTSLRMWHWSDDFRDAWRVVSHLCRGDNEIHATLVSLALKTRSMMEDYAIWKTVELIAAALLDRGTLSRRELWTLRKRGVM